MEGRAPIVVAEVHLREDLSCDFSAQEQEAIVSEDEALSLQVNEELASQLEALGLPSSFVAGNEVSVQVALVSPLGKAGTRRRKREQKTKTAVRSSSYEVDESTECTLEQTVVDGGEASWIPAWDDHYQRYYFYNAQTQETSWDPPKGLEDYVNVAADDAEHVTTVTPEPGTVETFEEHVEELQSSEQVLSVKRNRKTKLNQELIDAGISPAVLKYWYQRYSLFSKFDSGIKMDEEGWFSVTPEVIARHHAVRCSSHVIVDAFTGVGGNAIQFALRSEHVIAIDKDPAKIVLAKHNAEIYGVSDRIEFVVGDFFQLAPTLKADVIFLSPPWGGPDYLKVNSYNMSMLQPKDGFTLFKAAQDVAPNVALYLPRNVDLEQITELSWYFNPPLELEVEKNLVNGRLKAITVYYGAFAPGESD